MGPSDVIGRLNRGRGKQRPPEPDTGDEERLRRAASSRGAQVSPGGNAVLVAEENASAVKCAAHFRLDLFIGPGSIGSKGEKHHCAEKLGRKS
ncbi:hypothetical protein SKAU_G00025110 [Synaphobranchus kaupii]|uniref:Uncharacterized protein n=1 Tax=Synaphobranchus kaupii TaxID=118154 RepID=A0A9Q1JDI4_SYNKA|nr:hypothetical protein SKAU_G00025110 [Synaphobranchus kaupii]